MNFWDFEMWSGLLQLGVIALVILFANILRRKVGFLRKSLLPSAVIGGFVALLAKVVFFSDNTFLSANFLNAVTYHAIAIGFIALALKTVYKRPDSQHATKAVAWKSGMMIVGTYLVQGVVGLALTIALSLAIGLFPASGILLPMGFGQGPGQANNFGKIFEQNEGFVSGQSFALSIASIGFLVACTVGVVFLNILKKKGKFDFSEHKHLKSEEVVGTAENEIPLSESVDKFTMQVALVLGVLVATYLTMSGLDLLLVDRLGDFGTKTLRPLIWGFNFIFGTLLAMLFKASFKFLKKKKVMTREYCNNFLLNRIAGLMFDFMMVSAILLIDVSVMGSLILPLVLVCAVGTVATFVYVKIVSKMLYPEYELQGFLSMFGMLTGTASTGIALLREVDPNFETPAADNLVTGSSTAIVFGFPLMLLVGMAPSNPLLVLGLLVVFFVAINLTLFWRKFFDKRKKSSANAGK